MVGVVIAAAAAPRGSWRAVAVIGAACAVAPDLDAVPTLLGYTSAANPGAHRGLTHSVPFALTGAVITAACVRHRCHLSAPSLFCFAAVAMLSHGILDAFSDFGNHTGVAFFSPFWDRRFLAPWRPIAGEFSELFVCLIPFALLVAAAMQWRQLSLGIVPEKPLELGLRSPTAVDTK